MILEPGDIMENARYLYCVVRTKTSHHLGNIGIDDETVYTIPYGNVAAVVHRCRPLPYDTDDKTLAEGWILEHSYVIDQATKLFGTVLPFAFDVIIKGDDSIIAKWLKDNYTPLSNDLERVKGKSEYSVRIYCNFEELARRAQESSPEIKSIQNELMREPSGKAYLLSKRLELKRKDLMLKEANRLKELFCSRIRPLADEMMVDDKRGRMQEKRKKLELLASCSCLVSDENVKSLGEVLDEIQEQKEFEVNFTGPWAPFNFVNLMEAR